ncbi:MAG TPA: type II secretion system protein [Phycisphaerales bacterium]|nr:type II secretion system protein [Phycisphaerales bacterium]
MRQRGFTLIELLVAIFIIAVLVALVVPALSQVRNAARKTETTQFMNGLGQAIATFNLENKRPPGYFSAADMGSTENATRGFSNMQNMMLELAGGVDTAASPPLTVGPTNSETVGVDIAKIGLTSAGSKNYFTPQSKNYRKQNGQESGQRLGWNGGGNDNVELPELEDAFGAPILAWVIDHTAAQPVNAVADFAAEATPAGNTARPRFTWNGNAAFLSTDILVGKKRVAQTNQTGEPATARSLLGQHRPAAERAETMTGFLGGPGSPKDLSLDTDEILPTGARGSVVLHSAGKDGVFLNRSDRGGALAGSGPLHYGLWFKDLANNAWTDENGRSSTTDLLDRFDDITQTAE